MSFKNFLFLILKPNFKGSIRGVLVSVLLILAFLPTLALGAPASPEWFSVSQNGGDYEIRQRGDEFFSWYETQTGLSVFLNGDGDWEIQRENPDGSLGFVGTGNLLSPVNILSEYDTSPFFSSNEWRDVRYQRWLSQKELPTEALGSTYRLLVVLGYFSDHTVAGNLDESMVAGDESGSDYQSLLEGSDGVLNEFFNRESGQALSVDAHVTSWLPLNGTEASYLNSGENLVLDALASLESAGSLSGVSIDGSVDYDGVLVIHSGKNQARSTAGDSAKLWSGAGNLNSEVSILSGNIALRDFAYVAALGGQSEDSTTDPGILCHEVGHLLGLIDLQEYDDAGFGPGAWDLMGTGVWGFAGNVDGAQTPSPLGAWSRVRMGWALKTDLKATGSNVSLSSVQDGGVVFNLPTESSTEYFLLETRSPISESWASAPMGNVGLLIWHIEESGIQGNDALDWAHPLVKVEEADGDDSLGSGNEVYEEGDLWSFQSTLSTFALGSGNTGVSSRYEDGFYYLRSTGGDPSYFRIENIREESSGILFDFVGTETSLSVKSFEDGEVQWLPIEGATGYDLERRIGSLGSWTSLLDGVNQLTYTDNITGSDIYEYRVRADRYSDDDHWSKILSFGLSLESADFNPHTGVLTLEWNVPIEVSGVDQLDLNGLTVVDSSGDNIFSLLPSPQDFSYPGYEDADSVDATFLTTGAASQTVNLQLSESQRYAWITNSSTQNNDLFIEVESGSALGEISSGNLQNIEQSHDLGNAVSVSSVRDTTPPSIESVSYSDSSGKLIINYDEPLLISSFPSGSLFTLRGSNGLSTTLDSAAVVYRGDQLELTLSDRDRLRSILIQFQNSGNVIVDLPSSQITDISGVSHGALTWSEVDETPDETPPSIASFSLSGRDENRVLEVTFSEPVFFFNDVTPTAEEFGVVISNGGGDTLALGGNAVGSELESLTLSQEASDAFGAEEVPVKTISVSFQLSEEEVDALDAFNDELNRDEGRVFTNPAPRIFAQLSRNGNFSDYAHYLQGNFVCDKTSLVSSDDYTPRRRARFLHPHYDSTVTEVLGSQESLIWKWKHQIKYEINGGWDGDEVLQLEWENATLEANVITKKILETGISLDPDETAPFQYSIWDTTTEEEDQAQGYRLKIFRIAAGGDNVLLDTSAEVEIDNVAPEVRISYVSQTNPTHKVNANDVFVDQPSLYQGIHDLTTDEAENANVLIVATFSEPVIEAPSISINQPGLEDLSEVLMSASKGNILNEGGGNTSSVFYFAYDVQTQNGTDYIDGIASVEIDSVQDRAVGHLLAGTLSANAEEIQGNRSNDPPAEDLAFSIDTIPPTLSSLEFVILDESIIEEFSTLNLTYSEDMYRPVGSSDNTPLDSSGYPVTGVLSVSNYFITGSAGENLSVTSVDENSSGAGPYKLTLDGAVELGTLRLNVSSLFVKDLHNNVLGGTSAVSAVWPGPLKNRSEVFLPVRGRTRLLLSGGFPPYSLNIDNVYSGIAEMDGQRPQDILGRGLGAFTIEVTESRSQTRFVNVDVIDPYDARISQDFNAYRDSFDYRMVGLPFNLSTWDGAGLKEALMTDVGTMGEDYVLFTYGEDGKYSVVGDNTDAVGPGYGFWMASRKRRNIAIEGEGSWPLQVVGVDLHPGWNMIGNPFDQSLDVDEIFVSADGQRSRIRDLSQSQTANEIWSANIITSQYETSNVLQPFEGAWLYVNSSEGAELIYYRGEEEDDLEVDYEPEASQKSRLSQVLYPPGRPGSFSSSAQGGSGGGGGGCLFR